MSRSHHLHAATKPLIYGWSFLIFCTCLFLSATAISGTPIEHDPQGFFGIPWGNSLANREDLKEIDVSNSTRIYTTKQGHPRVEGIQMESVKLYVLEKKYARALFHYQGTSTHKLLLQFLEARFGKIERSYGGMMRGLNQQYTWRGPETEISITYHGFRERGLLIAESRVLAPLLLDLYDDGS
jgi:hypothetical protein